MLGTYGLWPGRGLYCVKGHRKCHPKVTFHDKQNVVGNYSILNPRKNWCFVRSWQWRIINCRRISHVSRIGISFGISRKARWSISPKFKMRPKCTRMGLSIQVSVSDCYFKSAFSYLNIGGYCSGVCCLNRHRTPMFPSPLCVLKEI